MIEKSLYARMYAYDFFYRFQEDYYIATTPCLDICFENKNRQASHKP